MSSSSSQKRHDDGEIQLILGPMFAGKTTELFRRMRRQRYAKQEIILIKHTSDTRYDTKYSSKRDVHTHDGIKAPSTVVKKLSEVDSEHLSHMDVIGIDEGQFFSDIVEFCEKWASRGKIVIVAALNADFQRKPIIE